MTTTEQERFWQGQFGDEYTDRSRGAHLVAANAAFFAGVLARTGPIHSVLELGSNLGLNLAALQALLPSAVYSAVEINAHAAGELRNSLPTVDLHVTSILDFKPTRTWDLVFTRGVLIHIEPAQLPMVYGLLHNASSRYILISEYYNPTPTEVPYRGHTGKLFKRDFAGELMEAYPDVSLLDYGFVYHGDPNFPQDDVTWFLMEKKA